MELDKKLIELARIEIEFEKIVREKETHYSYDNLLDYMLDYYLEDLVWYRIAKNYGYAAIILYKGVCFIQDLDHGLFNGLNLGLKIPEVAEWGTPRPLFQLKMQFLKLHCKDYIDRRFKRCTIKPTANRLWEEAKKEILGI